MHGIVEYLAAILFIAAPFLFDFDEDAATAVSLIVGVLILIIAASTALADRADHTRSRCQAHVMLDYVLAIFLIAAPFVLGFDDDGTAAAFFIVLGVLHLLLDDRDALRPRSRGRAVGTRGPSARHPRRRYWARACGSARSARRVPRRAPRAARRRARRHPVPGPSRCGGPAAHRPARRHTRRRGARRRERGRAAVGSRGLPAARGARAGRRELAGVRRPAFAQRDVRQRRAAVRTAPAPVGRRHHRRRDAARVRRPGDGRRGRHRAPPPTRPARSRSPRPSGAC